MPDVHERARLLLDRSLADPLAADDRRWLDGHLSGCAACARHGELSERAVRALSGFAFELDGEAASRVGSAVRARVESLATVEAQRRRARAGAAAAAALTALGSAVAWRLLDWGAARWNLPDAVWQGAFAALWIVPSLTLVGVLLCRGASGEGETA